MDIIKRLEQSNDFFPDIQNYQHFPKEHWKKTRTTNLMERVNKEIKGQRDEQESSMLFRQMILLSDWLGRL